jgi:hypothetical protein
MYRSVQTIGFCSRTRNYSSRNNVWHTVSALCIHCVRCSEDSCSLGKITRPIPLDKMISCLWTGLGCSVAAGPLTNYKEQSPPEEAKFPRLVKKFSAFWWNPYANCCVYKNPALGLFWAIWIEPTLPHISASRHILMWSFHLHTVSQMITSLQIYR